MSDVSQIILTEMELNNNDPIQQPGLLNGQRRKSVSDSSTNSDTSEDVDSFNSETKTKGSEGSSNTSKNEDQPSMEQNLRRTRSMSDGQTERLIPQEYSDVFPSLPDSVLNKLGLLGGDVHRERMTEEEVEQKFVTLALAFTIDSATIKDRCERQRRFRDQTETNLTTEIDKLTQKVTCIQPFCIDARTAELLTGLLSQIDVVIRASYHAAIAAERFGAVQHEEKLAEAVNLMISHVSLLKQQRESIRKQLQYTKKVLQDTNSCEKVAPKQDTSPNNRFITRRRASIATIVQPLEAISKTPPSLPNGDIRRISRRSSDLSTRVSALARTTRPSRLDLGVDLGKINEGVVEQSHPNETEANMQLTNITKETKDTGSTHSPTNKLTTLYARFSSNIYKKFEAATEDGSLQDFFIFSALMCFVLSIIILGNILVELEFSKRGIQPNLLWKQVFSAFPSSINYFEDKK